MLLCIVIVDGGELCKDTYGNYKAHSGYHRNDVNLTLIEHDHTLISFNQTTVDF